MMKTDKLIAPEASMTMILDRCHEKRFTSSIKTAAQIMMAKDILFFGILRIILTAASRIRIPTAIRIPLKALATQVTSRK